MAQGKGEPPFNKKYLVETTSGLGYEVVASPGANAYDLKLTK
jgi:hypothetical protein